VNDLKARMTTKHMRPHCQ